MTDIPEVPEITPAELKERLDAGDVPLLVDVREHFERDIADLPDHGQLRIPTGEFAGRMSEIGGDREVVVYCRSGGRSEWAAKLLMMNGNKKVLNLTGGVLRWRQDVDPSLRAY
jgi:adenylyltransferase/sulfurtransferase